ncbi:MAG: dienelactone hydrolase [Acidobacteria bacterium]|jgi:carboxymethylenebutenolidase|nr:dienelactone hydrolase [Acidobacteriota bacterium]MDP7619682.1 dienelactone hydrolase family protein [Dehalococcoidia bacterium]HJN45055.1 dienelactone hydrolase family protein [Vicinamibacterales bacterium]|tara:strand:+ start:1558 stop:2424 length:867 start_codon:yes stop_codon:yes gene_type:complete
MCDDRTVADNIEYLRGNTLTRRQFGAVSAGAGLAMLLPRVANAQAVTESEIDVTTPDGVSDSYFVHPSSGAHPGVLIWPDAFGLRDAKRQMAKRLAESGYSVLVVNQYYRSKRAPIVNSTDFGAERETLMPLMGTLNADTQTRDARAFISFLDSQASVDRNRQMGTMGYCMGGPFTMRTAAAVPDRVGAAASFHGGGLVTDADDSPHLLVPQMKAQYLFAIAANDDENQPEAKQVLREAFADAGLQAEIQVYVGAMHGWCPPDSGVYHEAQAERAWSRLLVLFENALS